MCEFPNKDLGGGGGAGVKEQIRVWLLCVSIQVCVVKVYLGFSFSTGSFWNCYPNDTVLSFCASLSHLGTNLGSVHVFGFVWVFSSPLWNRLLISWTESLPVLTFVPSLYLGEVGVGDHTYRYRGSWKKAWLWIWGLWAPNWWQSKAEAGVSTMPKAFPDCPITTLRKASGAPWKGWTLLLLKGGGGKLELLLAVFFPSF